MRQRQQADHRARGLTRRLGGGKGIEGPVILAARPQRVAVGEMGQGAGLGAQRGDDVPVADHVNRRSALGAATARQDQDLVAAEIGLDPVVMEPQP